MITQSCENCWYNGLQYGAVGLAVGYCALHRKILHSTAELTCGLHRRKDLSLARASQVSEFHGKAFPPSAIVGLYGNGAADGLTSNNETDVDLLRRDEVGEPVVDYGELGSKIESLAQLRKTPGARAEVALLSLARGYVLNCVNRGGNWISGIHLYWWTKSRLCSDPQINVDDLRGTNGLRLDRQIALSGWSVVMLRLTFIDDVVNHARRDDDPLGEATGLLDQAASAVNTFDIPRLLRWLGKNALPVLEHRLGRQRYTEMANRLHREGKADA